MKTSPSDRVSIPRYRRVSMRMHNDERYQQLSRPKPNGQSLWCYLLHGPRTIVVPGLLPINLGLASDDMRWPPAGTRRAWHEIATLGMARADFDAPLIWLPNAPKHNAPASPNVVNAWRVAFDDLPSCDLKNEAAETFEAFLERMGPSWIEAWLCAPGGSDGAYGEARLRRLLRSNPGLREQIKARDGDACRYCDVDVDWKDRRGPTSATYDHVDPAGPNSLENVVTTCRSCNSRKRRRTPDQAGMKLLSPRSGTRFEPRLVTEPTQVALANQKQDQKQKQVQPDVVGALWESPRGASR
jgi:hypothetical protein